MAKFPVVVFKPAAALSRRLQQIPPRLQFAVFMGATLVISLGLTALSYHLYVVSGTAQLDLSRPGYKAALSEVGAESGEESAYPSSGPLTSSTLDTFKQRYDAAVAKTKGASVFDPNALSDEQLNLNNSTVVGPQ